MRHSHCSRIALLPPTCPLGNPTSPVEGQGQDLTPQPEPRSLQLSKAIGQADWGPMLGPHQECCGHLMPHRPKNYRERLVTFLY